ncbi:hypothetical protein T484DRAFT_2016180, partial [Baffinella frigidus]
MDVLASMAETEQKASSDGANMDPAAAAASEKARELLRRQLLGKRDAPEESGLDFLHRTAAGGSLQKIREAEASAVEILTGVLLQQSVGKSAKKAAADPGDSSDAKRRANCREPGAAQASSAAGTLLVAKRSHHRAPREQPLPPGAFSPALPSGAYPPAQYGAQPYAWPWGGPPPPAGYPP